MLRGKLSVQNHASASVWQVTGEVLGVHDGDTITAKISLGWHISAEVDIRIDGIDSPELPTPEGDAAREFLSAMLPEGTPIIVTSHELDKYGRTLASVMKRESGADVASTMLATGHAVEYHGGARTPPVQN